MPTLKSVLSITIDEFTRAVLSPAAGTQSDLMSIDVADVAKCGRDSQTPEALALLKSDDGAVVMTMEARDAGVVGYPSAFTFMSGFCLQFLDAANRWRWQRDRRTGTTANSTGWLAM